MKGTVSLEEALATRRSIRSYTVAPLSLRDVSQLLWAAQGVTGAGGKRTAPSAHASYPLTLYLIASNIEGLKAGAYRYAPESHAIERVADGDLRAQLTSAQQSVREAPATVVVAVDYAKLSRFGERARSFADFEVGHAAENLLLEAAALHLGAVPVGGFEPADISKLLRLPASLTAAYLLPVGHPKDAK